MTNQMMLWDQNGQYSLLSCAYNGTTSSFTYGSDGLRHRMTVGSNVTDYVLDGQNMVQEILNGDPLATYLIGPRGVEYRLDGDYRPDEVVSL